jgi:aspartate/methionine/tyrosine aminotransferase
LAIHEIVRQASLHGVSILSDEVYRPFSALRSSFLPFVGEADTPVIVVDSASKWLAAAGLRIGFLVANEKLINSALMIRGTIDSCPSGPSQAVTALMLSDFAAETRTAIRQFVRTRVQGFVDLLTSEGISPKHSGGLFVWLSAKDPVLPWNDLEGRVLSGVSGAAFGMPGHVRFCPTCISDETAQYLGLEAWRPLEES